MKLINLTEWESNPFPSLTLIAARCSVTYTQKSLTKPINIAVNLITKSSKKYKLIDDIKV